jgi:two-component system, OmpR family, phosphate regulon sensor histidine kinase PhoR
MSTPRPIARTIWLALPASGVLAGLVLLDFLAVTPALAGWGVVLALSGMLAWRRERRLQATDRYLAALAEGHQPDPLPDFGPLGGDELATALHRLDRALAERRARQHETDQLVSTLLDALPDPVLLVARERIVVNVNRAAIALFGDDPSNRPLEAQLRDPGLLAAVDQAQHGRGNTELALQLLGPPRRTFGVQVMPVRLRGQPAALIAMRELTEQLMIEQMRSDFVANASHELRTPLAVVLGCIETLSGPARDDDEARERFLKIMAGEAARMTRLVDDLLSLSRIEQTEHQPPQSRVDPAACLEGVVETLRSYAEQRRVTLRLKRDPELPRVVGDRDQLVQLISNLIDNAIKYGGEGGKVELACEWVASAPAAAGSLAGRPAVRIIVADHGPGIAREHLPRLTERFFRVETARSRQLGGTGLGLAIVKHILRRHRGHLALESELGRGTTATVYLPVAESAKEARLSSNRHKAVT